MTLGWQSHLIFTFYFSALPAHSPGLQLVLDALESVEGIQEDLRRVESLASQYARRVKVSPNEVERTKARQKVLERTLRTYRCSVGGVLWSIEYSSPVV